MKKSRFSEEKIIAVLKQARSGRPTSWPMPCGRSDGSAPSTFSMTLIAKRCVSGSTRTCPPFEW